jgi:uncharacterized membrane protein
MIENLKTNIQIEETKNNKFRITFSKIDLADSDSVLKNIDELRQAIKQHEEFLSTVDKQMEIRKSEATKLKAQNEEILKEFIKIENKARLWKKIAEEKDKRLPESSVGIG